MQRWLGELSLALRQESDRPDPIRRVFLPKANGKLRPLGTSTLREAPRWRRLIDLRGLEVLNLRAAGVPGT